MPNWIDRISDERVSLGLKLCLGGVIVWWLFIEAAPIYSATDSDGLNALWLFQVHLFLVGLFLFWQLRDRPKLTGFSGIKQAFLVEWPGWGLVLTNVAIPATSLFEWHVDRMWSAPLILVAALSALALYRRGISTVSDLPVEDVSFPEDSVERDPQTNDEPEKKEPSMLAKVWSEYLVSLTHQVLTGILVIVTMGLGMFYYTVLYQSLSPDSSLTLERLLTRISALAESLSFMSVAVGFAVGVIVLIMAVAHLIYILFQLRKRPDYDRELSDAELDYIEENSNKVADFADDFRETSGLELKYIAVYFGVLIGSIGIGVLLAFFFLPYLGGLVEAARSENETVLHYAGIDFGVSGLLILLTAIALGSSFAQLLAFISPRMAVYFQISGWNKIGEADRTFSDYYFSLTDLVRRGIYRPGQVVDPHRFLLLCFRRYEGLNFALSVVLCIMTLGFGYLDLRHHRMFTENEIVYSEYFSFDKKTMPYTDLRYVELSCYTYVDDGDLEIGVGYDVYLTESRSAELLPKKNSFRKRQTELMALDQKLQDAGVKFIPKKYRNEKRKLPGFIPDCRSILVNEYSAELGNELANFLKASP